MAGKTYKTQLGAIPKIVNNFNPKTSNQNTFYNIMGDVNTQLILCHGIAGTGKTYVSIYKALQDVLRRGTPYHKLIIFLKILVFYVLTKYDFFALYKPKTQ